MYITCACSMRVPKEVVGPNILSATLVTLHFIERISMLLTFEILLASSTVDNSIVAVLAGAFYSQATTGSLLPGSLR